MKLTQHFTLEELVRSQTAQSRGIVNSLPLEYLKNLKTLCETILEPLRQHFGQPVIVTSGFRCPALNRAVGGAKNSYHLQGRAADIVPFNRSKQTLNEWYHYLATLHPKELIHEGTWLHVAI